MGIERLLALLETSGMSCVEISDVYMIRVGKKPNGKACVLLEAIRNQVPGLKLEVNCGGGQF